MLKIVLMIISVIVIITGRNHACSLEHHQSSSVLKFVARLDFPKGPNTQIVRLQGPKTIQIMDFGT